MLPTLHPRRHGMPTVFSPVDRMFDRFVRDWWESADVAEPESSAAYPVDLREEDGRYVVDAEMPGFSKDEVDVEIEDDRLHISAERQTPEQAPQGRSHLRERQYTRVERTLALPGHVDPENVEARLADGVLHLELPKTEKSNARKIELM